MGDLDPQLNPKEMVFHFNILSYNVSSARTLHICS